MTYRQLDEAWDYRGSIRTTHEDSSPWFPQETPPVLPDIVLVVRDDVRFADLGCFGSEIQTPHMDAVAAAPPLEHGSYRIEALASVPLEGVVIAYGSSSSGFVLYARSGRLVYEYNRASGMVISTKLEIPDVDHATLGFVFEPGPGRTGRGRRFVDDRTGDWLHFPHVLEFLAMRGMDVGRDSLSPISTRYEDHSRSAVTRPASGSR